LKRPLIRCLPFVVLKISKSVKEQLARLPRYCGRGQFAWMDHPRLESGIAIKNFRLAVGSTTSSPRGQSQMHRPGMAP
jgi:hypothetical protein